jgi:ATP-GRASP peptide maturase of grasp-with-spasm system
VILIFTNSNDPSPTNVMRRLQHMGVADVLRINEPDVRERPVHLELGDDWLRFSYGDVEVDLDAVRAVWYRKGGFWFDNLMPKPALAGHPTLAANMSGKLAHEDSRAREYFHHLLASRARTLGHAGIAGLNKLVVLSIARKLGLATPVSIVSNRREPFVWSAGGRSLVTKALSDGVYLWDFSESQAAYFSYTERVSPAQLAQLPEEMPLSLAQLEIEKDFEVRSFYLDGDFYSTAIFSQTDSSTAVDYRKYNYEKQNRNVPYRLPIDIEEKLRRLFATLGLNTGSVDLIVDRCGRHHFLEINPSGQYEGLSQICNYDLDGKIAEWLAGAHDAGQGVCRGR